MSVDILGYLCSTSTQKTFGLIGGLAYSEPSVPEKERTAWDNPRAGYVGRNDLAFLCEGEVIGVIELKMVDGGISSAWHKQGSTLPQILCWLGGTITGVVGLVISNLGSTSLYRELQEKPDEFGNPVFKYFNFPPNGLFDDCRGTSGAAGRLRLLRSLFEMILCCSKKSSNLPRPGPIQRQPSRSSSGSDAYMKIDEEDKRAELNVPSENVDQLNGPASTEPVVGSDVISSYDHSVILGGSDQVLTLTGMELITRADYREDTESSSIESMSEDDDS